MLTYLASEDPETLSRDRRVFERGPEVQAGAGRFPQPTAWPACRDAIRDSKGYVR
jgi:capsular polysaccharide biosynthesis protein